MNANIFSNNNLMIIKSIENQIRYKFEYEIRSLSKRIWQKSSMDCFRNLLCQRKMVLNKMCFDLNSFDGKNNFEIINNKLINIYENIFNRIAKFSNSLLINYKNVFLLMNIKLL